MEWESNYTYEPTPLFEHMFICRPFSKYKNPNLETGDKIIMPPSSLSQIVSVRLKYPLFFQIKSYNEGIVSHCGVLEFDAEEGFIHMPEWMMKNLKLQEGDLVIIRNAAMPKGRYIKLQPHTTSFIEVSDPRAVLEKTLRSFTCLTRGDTIMLTHNKKEFYIDILEVRPPGGAICLIDTDCEVDFATPLDYKEPEAERPKAKKEDDEKKFDIVNCGDKKEERKEFRPFTGKARRLEVLSYAAVVKGLAKVVIEEKIKDGGKEAIKEEFKAFTGRSYSLGGV
ncbi:hypothetical protein BUALT_Bualt05G0009500 [Buddleja alternifolia]|uniref:Ubiquitin fusion degradaton protein n=1 Tax=Buddleja alternifolia TaxID=168488 RepID=A0AAV6XFB5_9LAMI|nr:hypothetical protein BUALT_Bualt05G0009500 [Buddleja alternifolia]